MRRDATPAPDELLCERCGYLLTGLPPDGSCPECGLPVAASTIASPRRPTVWEAGRDRGVGRFQATAIGVLIRPKPFFRHLTAYGDLTRSRQFGKIALLPAILFNTKTILMHFYISDLLWHFPGKTVLALLLPVTPVVVALTWLMLYALVVRLTTIESRYWGMRLPPDVVRRALHYDAVSVSAASLLPWAVTLTFLCVVVAGKTPIAYGDLYLYALSVAVVIAAVYLFFVYAASMRAMMYANR